MGNNTSDKIPTAYLVDLVSNRKIPITVPRCKVGRDELNDVVITGDQSISRFHFVIAKENDQYQVQDSKSRHGTFLNGDPVADGEILKDGDVLKVGVSLFWFVLETAGSPRTSMPPTPQEILNKESSIDLKASQPGAKSSIAKRTNPNVPALDNSPPASTSTEEIKDNSEKTNQPEKQEAGLGKFLNEESNQLSPTEKAAPIEQLPESGPEHGATLELFAEVIGEAAKEGTEQMTGSSGAKDLHGVAGNGATSTMSVTKESKSGDAPPNWCEGYLGNDLQYLNQELTNFRNQAQQAQQKAQELEERINTTRDLRDALLTSEGDHLVDACIKVLTYLGWQAEKSSEDKQELQLKTSDKVCIARVVWTNNIGERNQLGQLTIAQTKYWCEQGQEPKGVLIIRNSNEQGQPSANLSNTDAELADYAAKKNICLMTTVQLLCLYRDAVLKNSNVETLRRQIVSGSGWLKGFTMEENTGSGDRQETGGGSSLSSLLSA